MTPLVVLAAPSLTIPPREGGMGGESTTGGGFAARNTTPVFTDLIMHGIGVTRRRASPGLLKRPKPLAAGKLFVSIDGIDEPSEAPISGAGEGDDQPPEPGTLFAFGEERSLLLR